MNAIKQVDYIFGGMGLATMLIISELINTSTFHQKQILIIDSNPKLKNDRTWSFWTKEQEIIPFSNPYKKWSNIIFADEKFSKKFPISPYHYETHRADQFYQNFKKLIAQHANIHIIQENIISFHDKNNGVLVTTDTNQYFSKKYFNAIFDPKGVSLQKKYPLVWQHFLGWVVRTKSSQFDVDTATFMDFSIPQKGNTRFMYILPFSKNEALFEYTLFSKDILSPNDYETAIVDYLNKNNITEYEIIEKEIGAIPMSVYPFWKHNTRNIMHIGSSGGWTKATTGFTLYHATKKANKLTDFLQKHNDFTKINYHNRFWFYDMLLIDILYYKNHWGSKIFSNLFEKGNSQLILKFLDEETNLWEELKVIWRCPKLPFIQALLRRLF